MPMMPGGFPMMGQMGGKPGMPGMPGGKPGMPGMPGVMGPGMMPGGFCETWNHATRRQTPELSKTKSEHMRFSSSCRIDSAIN